MTTAVSNSSPRFSSTPSTLAQVLIKSMKTPSKTAIVGAIVGAVVLLISIVTMLFFCRRRYTPKTPVGNIGGTEREPDPTLDSARDNLLNGDGQPADHEGVFPDTVSETSTKQKKTATSIAAITEGIAHGASLAGDAVLSLQRRLFKRLTATETTAEMELEPSVFGSEFPEDSTPEIQQEGFFAKVAKKNKTNSTVELTAKDSLDRDDGQLKPSSLVCETPVDSTPEIPREGFFAKMTRKTRKAPTAESTAKEVLSGDDGLTFQERLFKRSTTKSTIENTPEVEMESPFLNEESVSSTDSEQHSSSANENKDTPPLSATKGSGFLAAALFNVRPRLFKRTATETTFSENNDLGTDSSAIERSTSPEAQEAGLTTNASTESTPKGSFMLKLRHKFSNPTVVSDPESASDPEFSDFHIIPPGEENEISSILTPTDGYNSAPAPVASSSRSEPDLVVREPSPPPFDAEESSTEHAPSTPTIRSLSTMKRDQTRAILGGPEAGESSPYPDDPPTTEPPTISRSLSTMKRDQTRLLSRDRQHSATDVLVQTPDGLHLTPGQGRVISTDESGAVASEVRDLREYIRVLEADLAAGGRNHGEFILAPPPSYDETSTN